MRLQDYIRPPDDNGIGMHWSGGNPNAVGTTDLRQQWIPELQRMGVKWVKILHDGGVEFASMLLAAGIMPIVRLYRYGPNSTDLSKAVLTPKEIEHLDRYVAIGVRYFEFNNEPELHGEWDGGRVPENAIDYVARAAIRDMETILEHGGYPAVPATAIGTRWDLIGKIIEHGGRPLFDEPVWLAVHNYDINHPLDYPYDTVNQTGEQISAEEYDRLGMSAWQGQPWGRRTREFVNEQRRLGANPGHTIHDDASCFLAYERLTDLCQQHLGRHLPILSTENGPIVGEADDPRYPTTTADAHAEKAVEQARIMMGISQRYAAAPPYYFCTAFWLMGNAVLRGTGWEDHAWFSVKWPGGRLPAVDALAALPKIPRTFVWEDDGQEEEAPTVAENSVIAGLVHGHPGARIFLRSSAHSAQTTTDESGRFRFDNLPAGAYRLTMPGTDLFASDLVLDGYNQIRLELGAEQPPAPPEEPEEPEEPPQEETGPPQEEQPAPVTSGWEVKVSDAGPSPGFGVIRASVAGMAGLPVRISAAGWSGYTQNAGSKPEHGPYSLEFAPLGAGHYTLTPAELGIEARIEVDAARVLRVEFHPTGAPPAPAGSVIAGQVTNGAGHSIVLRGADFERSYLIGADETYRFEGLPAGTYSLAIPGTSARRSGLEMDGANQRTANFTVEPLAEPRSAIHGSVRGGAGQTLILQGPEHQEWEQRVGEDERFAFTGLPAGDYLLILTTAEGVLSEGVTLDGRNSVEIDLELPTASEWEAKIVDGGPGPGFGVVRVRVVGQPGLAVRLWTHGWSGIVQRTGDKPEYGADACEFAPLGGGDYFVEPEGLGLQTPLHIDGSRVIWVHFEQSGTPQAAPAPVPAKTIDHYLLVADPPSDLSTYLAVLRYVSRFMTWQDAPVVGASLTEARLARRVTILGDVESISAADEARLAASGAEVERISDAEIDRVLEQRLEAGKPW